LQNYVRLANILLPIRHMSLRSKKRVT